MLYEDAKDAEVERAAREYVRMYGWREVVMVPLHKRLDWASFDTAEPNCSISVAQVHFHKLRNREVFAEVRR